MNDVEQRRPFRAERAAIHRMIRIALDVNDVGPGVLGAVAEAVDDDAAGDRAVGAGITRLGRGRELERSDGSRQRFAGQTKSKGAKRRPRQAGAGELDKPRRFSSTATPPSRSRRQAARFRCKRG